MLYYFPYHKYTKLFLTDKFYIYPMKHLKVFEEFSSLRSNGDWVVFAGLGGGFGGANEQGIWSGEKHEAESEAYRLSVEEYDNYDGMHGLRSLEDIMEEDEVSEEDAQYTYDEERENWLDYYVEPYDSDKHESDPTDETNKLN